MPTCFRSVLLTTLLGLLLAEWLGAETEARVYGKVVDESEQPVAGMTIAVSDPDVANFSLVTETDGKGKYSLVLPDATRAYVYRLEKEGYEAFETSFKVPAGARQEMNFTVLSAAFRAPALFNEGNAAVRAGDYAVAEAKYREALALDPRLAAARAALASVLLFERQYAAAARQTEEGLDLEPGSQKLLTLRYKAYQALGDKANAGEALAALEAADPGQAAEGLYQQGLGHYEGGRMNDAAEAFEKALAADSGHAKAHYFLGLCRINLGDSASAKEHLTTFLALAPEDPEAESARGMLEYLQ